jgi:serine/threonine protein kinase
MQETLNGSYGKTYDAQWILQKEPSIVLIKMDKQPTNQEMLFYTGLKSHPHIIHSFGFVENDLQSILLLQECATYGNLQILLEKNLFQPSVKVLVQIFFQIVNAMIFITQQNLVHGDLRCANILVFQMSSTKPEENLFKLTNFTS